jgi:hypothetical protein
MLFDRKNIYHYLFAFSLILTASYVGNKFKQNFVNNNDEYELIKKYLLNDSPLYGFNKPKIWIHSKYDINARKWKDFQSRNTTNLNQPYLHITIQSIIDHCGDDFHICLIDDETFSKLIPDWDIDVSTLAEPMKTRFRELGLLQLIYYYGGMVVPDSFLCLKNLRGFYNEGLFGGHPFVSESINRTTNLVEQKNRMLFLPNIYFVGSNKNDSVILDLIKYLKQRNQSPHFTSQIEFLGDTSQWLIKSIRNQKMNLVGGETIGIKTSKRKQILLENLMEEQYLDLDKNCYGIYIPADEILKRTKYQWFAVLDKAEIMQSNLAIVKYMKSSIVDANDEYYKSTTIKNVITL